MILITNVRCMEITSMGSQTPAQSSGVSSRTGEGSFSVSKVSRFRLPQTSEGGAFNTFDHSGTRKKRRELLCAHRAHKSSKTGPHCLHLLHKVDLRRILPSIVPPPTLSRSTVSLTSNPSSFLSFFSLCAFRFMLSLRFCRCFHTLSWLYLLFYLTVVRGNDEKRKGAARSHWLSKGREPDDTQTPRWHQ